MWKLKNEALQEKLDELTRYRFSQELNERMEEALNPSDGAPVLRREEQKALLAGFGTLFFDTQELGEGVEIDLVISVSALKEVPTYDPSKWNEWPLMPPYCVDMCIEYLDESGVLRRTCGSFHKNTPNGSGCWLDFNGSEIKFRSLRFKPWQD